MPSSHSTQLFGPHQGLCQPIPGFLLPNVAFFLPQPCREGEGGVELGAQMPGFPICPAVKQLMTVLLQGIASSQENVS